MAVAADHCVYLGTWESGYLLKYDPKQPEKGIESLGKPSASESYIWQLAFAADGERLYLCAYPRAFLSVYEPAKPWHYGKAKESNPRGLGFMGEGHLRPRAMVVGPDHRVYVGSLAPYGQTGGALGIYDPKSDSVVGNYPHLITNQGISALCFDPATNRLFGGSSIEAGGGARAVAKECVLFAWDTKTQQKIWEEAVVKGDRSVGALTAAQGKIFGVTMPSSTLIVIDPKTFQVLSKAHITFGHFHEISLAYFEPHNKIYGLAGQSLFAVDPETFEMSEVARNKDSITCGFALTETGVYFGSGKDLVRWRW
jgi:hypothetical protein